MFSMSSPEVFKTNSSMSLPNKLQENPMLMAVSTLSPVKTQSLIPALLKRAIESGTPSFVDEFFGDESNLIWPQLLISSNAFQAFNHDFSVLCDQLTFSGGFFFDIDTLSLSQTSQGFGVCSTVTDTVDGTLLELHDVLRQSTSLIGEDIFNLTQVIRDIPGFRSARIVQFFIVHHDI
ncbi:hypothetical protein WICPIJ_006628 [Wickerhamomyces pijperi]|uniref:Uncharacterized protein n=1 Tax=Wickerhamomyces pijperi TaxID=599730 RepID=A0A9P8Q1R8_WICPI|nr:hypothetical protein WICPIJ_006628 [Wickerhamomyces pijperi]